MKLFHDENLFAVLNIDESAVERDYYIVMVLKALANSEFKDNVVFKGYKKSL